MARGSVEVNARLERAVLAVAEMGQACETLDPKDAADLRRAVTHDDPLLFALTYLVHHLLDESGNLSLSEVHERWIDYAKGWGGRPAPSEERDAFIAPREMGKSTWVFLLLPMWAAATGRVKFAAAFADSATQAETHLSTFKRELDENARLRADYPDLCKPAVRPRGMLVSDNRAMLHTAAGFVFAARGIDSGNLGMKVGQRRPDLLILDDVEPGESNYSEGQVEKRLATILDVVLPLNVRARVCLVGTVTMPGSIIHQLVQHAAGEELVEWVKDENFRIHHEKPVVYSDDGEARSVWPEKWPLDYLRGIEHTRSYAKNFLNQPIATDGDYWRPGHFVYEDPPGVTTCLLSVDPAVTTKKTSDYSGLAVVGLVPGAKPKAVVKHAERVKLRGAPLRERALALCEEYPEVTHVLVESNQGGDLWLDVFHSMPVKVIVKHNSDPKEVRAASAVNRYERGRVVHAKKMPEVEAEMCSFPKAPHDDVVDAIDHAVNRLLPSKPKKKRTATAATVGY
jgi:phage terminase large subunit-like protein